MNFENLRALDENNNDLTSKIHLSLFTTTQTELSLSNTIFKRLLFLTN